MNRGATSAPTNWAIDYGQNQTGAIYGNAMANTGGMLGNAIMQYAADKKKKDEEKAKKEAAIAFLGKQGIAEDEAKGIVNGVGIDNFMKFKQADLDAKQVQQRQQQIDQEDARIKAQEAQIAQKAQELQKREANLQKFMGQVSGSAPWRNAPAQSPQDVFAAAARTGVDPGVAATVANSLPPPAKQSSQLGEVIKIDDKTRAVRTSSNSIQILQEDGAKKTLTEGSEHDLTRNGKTIKAIWDGTKFKEKSSGLDVDLEETDALGRRTKRNNPDVWGGGVGGSSQPSSPITPAVNIGRFRVTTQ